MTYNGEVIVVSNRNVNPKETSTKLFGDELNAKGADELNVALANKSGSSWKLKLITNPSTPAYKKPKSKDLFKEVLINTNKTIAASADGGKEANWVVFVHGFNQSLTKNLNKCEELKQYGANTNVIAFSWPSNPGPQEWWKKTKEYKRARKNAQRSVMALNRFLEKMYEYATEASSNDCKINISLVVHSLGNFLLENFVRSSVYENECSIYQNIILHQADADTEDHEDWVKKLTKDARVYVTINDKDAVLCASDLVNKNRLGNSSDNCVLSNVKYFNFTKGAGVGISHRPWHDPGKAQVYVKEFYENVLTGRRGEHASGWEFSSAKNYYYPE